jgi:hypothetical protein
MLSSSLAALGVKQFTPPREFLKLQGKPARGLVTRLVRQNWNSVPKTAVCWQDSSKGEFTKPRLPLLLQH